MGDARLPMTDKERIAKLEKLFANTRKLLLTLVLGHIGTANSMLALLPPPQNELEQDNDEEAA